MASSLESLSYCVLRHTVPRQGAHYDLLLSVPRQEALTAWRLNDWPPEPPPREQVVTLLPDHRCLYLQYEGPIAGNRGLVRRVESGTIQYRERSRDLCSALLCSQSGEQRSIKIWKEKLRTSAPEIWKLCLETVLSH